MFHFYKVKQDAEVRTEIQVTERWNKSITSRDAKKDQKEEQNGIQFSVYNY